MDGITRTGLTGIQAGLYQAEQASARITQSFSSDPNTEGLSAMTDLVSAQQQVAASAKVVKVGQDLQNYVLNIVA